MTRAEALAAAGRVGEAFGLLSGEERNAAALVALAHWRLAGNVIRRDLEEARRLFGRAADLGHPAAEPVYTAMLGNGAGAERRWGDALARLERLARTDDAARREAALIQAMDLTAEGDPKAVPAGEAVSRSPAVTMFPGFLAAAECRYLIDVAAPLLQPSLVVEPRTGRLIANPVRTSAAAAFPFVLESPAIHAINRRIAAATGTLADQGEPLQILRYEPGQEYKPHSDALAGVDNQRVLTALVYLNTDFEGGETLFLQPGLKIRGGAGDALVFRNVTDDGAPDPAARHAGLPVTRGQKVLLSRWIRARPLDLSGPPGRPF